MTINLTSGISGVSIKDFKVYIREEAVPFDNSLPNLVLPFRVPESLNELDMITDRTIVATRSIVADAIISNFGVMVNVDSSSEGIEIDTDGTEINKSFFALNVTDVTHDIELVFLPSNQSITTAGVYFFEYTTSVPAKWNLVNTGFFKLGELRRDSITPKLENGETIDLNESGVVVLNKTGSFEFSLINMLSANIAVLEALNKTSVCFLFVSTDLEQLGYILPIIFNYNERFISGQVQELPIVLKKVVNSASEFRQIHDISELEVNITNYLAFTLAEWL